ncbi:MAG: hypothetical protein IT381_11835 [Deltaproteobacteria bacterium]|nr:hypothetical protein [Deltaproteobacteria bacterium]
MTDHWMVREKDGLIVGPFTTDELGKAIARREYTTQTFVNHNGSAYRPVGDWPQLQAFKAAPARDLKPVLLPIAGVAAAIFVALVIYLVVTAKKDGAGANAGDPLIEDLVREWPDALVAASADEARELTGTDPAGCERKAVYLLQKSSGDDAALRALAVCSALADRFGLQKHRDALLDVLEKRGVERYGLEIGALLSMHPTGDRGARAEQLLRATKEPVAAELLADLLIDRLPAKPTLTDEPAFTAAWLAIEAIKGRPVHSALAAKWAIKSAHFAVDAKIMEAEVDEPSTAAGAIMHLRLTFACEWGVRVLSAIAKKPVVPPAALIELGLQAAACGVPEAAASITAHVKDSDPAQARAAKHGLAAIKMGFGDPVGAAAVLADTDAPAERSLEAGAAAYVRGVLALARGDAEAAGRSFQTAAYDRGLGQLAGAYVGLYVAEKLQKVTPTEGLPAGYGPAGPFIDALLSDKVDDVRLDPLFDAPDALHALNPAKIPLLPAIVGAAVERVRKKPTLTESDRALIALFEVWQGKTPKGRAAGEGGTLVAALIAMQHGQMQDALKALDRLLRTASDDPPLGLASLRARIMERIAPETSDEVWAQLAEQNEELEPAAEMAAARAALRGGDKAGAEDRYRALYFSREAPFEAMRALALIGEAK